MGRTPEENKTGQPKIKSETSCDQSTTDLQEEVTFLERKLAKKFCELFVKVLRVRFKREKPSLGKEYKWVRKLKTILVSL